MDSRIAELGLPEQFSVIDVVNATAQVRGKPIRVTASPEILQTSICGMLLEMPTEDIILYGSSTSLFHQEHTILHEIGHLLCGHHGDTVIPADLVPDLDMAVVRAVLYRGRITTATDSEQHPRAVDQEAAAEHFATRLSALGITHDRKRRLLGNTLEPSAEVALLTRRLASVITGDGHR